MVYAPRAGASETAREADAAGLAAPEDASRPPITSPMAAPREPDSLGEKTAPWPAPPDMWSHRGGRSGPTSGQPQTAASAAEIPSHSPPRYGRIATAAERYNGSSSSGASNS